MILQRWVLGLLLLLALVLPTWSATVTVNPSVALVAGSNYHQVGAALANFQRGDTWGNGAGDTVLIHNGNYLMGTDLQTGLLESDTLDPVVPGGDGTLTIKAAAGQSPVIAMDPNPTRSYFMYFRRQGNYTVEGLTFVGAAGVPTTGGGIHRSVLGADSEDFDGVVVSLTVRDCVFTMNDGSNGAVMDFSGAVPTDSTNGTYQRAFYSGDSTNQGILNVLIENCVMAYSNHNNGAIRIERDVADCADTRTFTFRNVLVVSSRTGARVTNGAECNTTINFEECAFVNLSVGGLRFTDGVQGAKTTIKDCIISTQPTGSGSGIIIEDPGCWLNLTAERCTFWNNNNDMVWFTNRPENGQDKIVIRDLIDVDGNDALFRYDPYGSQPASITVEEGIASHRAIRAEHPDNLKALFSSLYGGAGPIASVPLSDFVNTSFNSSVFADIRMWDKESNNFFDISPVVAEKYQGKGNGGGNLTGGADLSAFVPPTPTPAPPTATPTPTNTFPPVSSPARFQQGVLPDVGYQHDCAKLAGGNGSGFGAGAEREARLGTRWQKVNDYEWALFRYNLAALTGRGLNLTGARLLVTTLGAAWDNTTTGQPVLDPPWPVTFHFKVYQVKEGNYDWIEGNGTEPNIGGGPINGLGQVTWPVQKNDQLCWQGSGYECAVGHLWPENHPFAPGSQGYNTYETVIANGTEVFADVGVPWENRVVTIQFTQAGIDYLQSVIDGVIQDAGFLVGPPDEIFGVGPDTYAHINIALNDHPTATFRPILEIEFEGGTGVLDWINY